MDFYEESIGNFDMRWAIDNEYGVPPICTIATVDSMDLTGVTVSGGDFHQLKLQAELNKEANLHAVAVITERERHGQTVVFTPSVFSARGVSHFLNNNYGVPSVFIWGSMPDEERAEALAEFKSGRAQVLVNCQVVAIGFDFPPTATLILARPTRSRSFWLQCVGRATRPLAGVVDGRPYTGVDGTMGLMARRTARLQSDKTHFKIVDLTNGSLDHRLITSVDMFCTAPAEDIAAVRKTVASSPKPLTPEEMQELAAKLAEKRAAAILVEQMRNNTSGRATGRVSSRSVDLAFTGKRSVGTYSNPLRGKFAGVPLSQLPQYYVDWAAGNHRLTHWIRGMFRKELGRRGSR